MLSCLAVRQALFWDVLAYAVSLSRSCHPEGTVVMSPTSYAGTGQLSNLIKGYATGKGMQPGSKCRQSGLQSLGSKPWEGIVPLQILSNITSHHTIPRHAMPHNTTQQNTRYHNITLHNQTPHDTMSFYCATEHHTIWYYTIQNHIPSYYTLPHHIGLHYSTPYHTTHYHTTKHDTRQHQHDHNHTTSPDKTMSYNTIQYNTVSQNIIPYTHITSYHIILLSHTTWCPRTPCHNIPYNFHVSLALLYAYTILPLAVPKPSCFNCHNKYSLSIQCVFPGQIWRLLDAPVRLHVRSREKKSLSI